MKKLENEINKKLAVLGNDRKELIHWLSLIEYYKAPAIPPGLADV